MNKAAREIPRVEHWSDTMLNPRVLVAGTAIALSTMTQLMGATDGAQPTASKQPEAPKQGAATPAKRPDLSKEPTLYVVGYAHLDTQWRWTYADTIREFIPKTLTDNFRLFDKYPSYVFNFSGSRRYKMMEEYYPADYAKLKGYVAAGRWYPCGSSVDENDANVPSAESLVRQVLYGNNYFRQHFGVASDEYMLPDCFGFPAALPSVLAHCGVKGFSTQKLTWNAVTPIPFKVGIWEGPDGHSIMAALDPGAYVGEVQENLARSNGWTSRIDANGKKSGVYVDYHYYGTGDTGGAPSEKSVAMVEESVGTAGGLKVISGPADWMFNNITPAQQKGLPKYKGELELTEHSAGSISSQAYMKRWNRKNELLADAAERASVMAMWMGAREYPSAKLEDAWYLVLGSQMHDILPGTSVPKAYEFSWNDEVIAGNHFASILTDAAGSVIAGMDTRSTGSTVVVYNATSSEREDIVEATVTDKAAAGAKGVKVTGPDGKDVPAQILGPAGTGSVKIAFLAKAPSVGFAAYGVSFAGETAGTGSLKVDNTMLENSVYVVKLDANGDVASIYDKGAKKELLSGPARLGLHYENPRNWPAWNQDWSDRQMPAKGYFGNPAKVEVVERGPARVALAVTRMAEGSTVTQTIRLAAGPAEGAGGRVEFSTDIEWRSKERSLRAAFPLAVSNPQATYDIQVGALQRGNGHEKQYEYPFHQWFDLTDTKGDYGVSVMSDSKYASDKPDDHTVRLTLLHTPGTRGGYPDQGTQDLGRHHVTYAVYGHQGDWSGARSFDQAMRVNQPLIAFNASSHEGTLGKAFSLMKTSTPAVEISATKKAELSDEVVIRLREHSGKDVKGVKISAARPIVSARAIDGQERELGAATVQNGELVTDMNGFELRAFAVKLGDAPAKLAKATSATVALTYDTDVASTNTKRDDGSFDGKGAAMPAEQFPTKLKLEGVEFAFGPTADGQKNAVSCNGQEIKLPAGEFDTVYLLASANTDVNTTLKVGSNEIPWKVQAWNGMVGQWDRRVWNGDGTEGPGGGLSELLGIEPGYVKQDEVAWACSHHHTAKGDAFYEYSYIFKYPVKAEGATSITLPKNPAVKVFAVSVAKMGAASATPAAPLFDTLDDHTQDRPVITPSSGSFADATSVKIEPALYWRKGAVRYTTDGSEPTATSAVYSGPMTIGAKTTLKAAVFGADGQRGPVASAQLDVNDTTAPTVTSVTPMYQSPIVQIAFSEAVDDSATNARCYEIEPTIDVKSVTRSADGKTVSVTLANAPEMDKTYQVKISGVKDASAAKNQMKSATVEMVVHGPVYKLGVVSKDQMGKEIKDVKGLPTKAADSWTMNMFVKTDKQPANRTVIAGFGRCEQTTPGQARYLTKFPGGIHFWSHNRDVEGRTPLELNKWQMLTATYDGKTLRVYKDAQLIGERAVDLVDDVNVVNIAPADPWDHTRKFEGEICEFTIWSGALGESALRTIKSTATLP